MQKRAIFTFFLVFFAVGAIFLTFGVIAKDYGLTVDMFVPAKVSVWHLWVLTLVVGGLSGIAMIETDSGKQFLMQAAGAPLFFILGVGTVEPILLIASVLMFYVIGYLVCVLIVVLADEKDRTEVYKSML